MCRAIERIRENKTGVENKVGIGIKASAASRLTNASDAAVDMEKGAVSP